LTALGLRQQGVNLFDAGLLRWIKRVGHA